MPGSICITAFICRTSVIWLILLSCTYVVDAVDTVTAKIDIVMAAKEAGVPVISAMGAGNKIHPELFEVADIYETSVCPLAKVMRRELKKRKVDSLKVVYSKEKARTPIEDMSNQLQGTLRLPAGCTKKVYRPQSNPGKYGLYTVCHGTDHGR